MKLLNTISNKPYSSKLILLGEYAVIQGGEILASPLAHYTARWRIDKRSEYNKGGLQLIYDYLKINENNKIDLELFSQAINDGIHLESTIPTGYGLGSSGAITAGIYEVFVPDEKKASNISRLKEDLIAIESCFHGVSSGIDPLVIYLNKCVHIDGKGINILEDSVDLSHYFLIDTKMARKTTPLVKQYINRSKDESYLAAIDKYKEMCAAAISAQLSDNQDQLSTEISNISCWQYEYLDFAILEEYRNLWQTTLDRDDMSIKLCGAGGGGFLLGYAKDMEKAMVELSEYELIRL